MKEPVGVIGVGWVGLVTAACFAKLGHEVWARDVVAEKVESLARGELPLYEPGLEELVAEHRERLHFTTEMDEVLEAAELLFCCVDTPATYSGDADLSRVETVIGEIGESERHALVMKSTVPVGTGRSIERRLERVAYVSNPEFLQEGSAVEDFMHPDRVVIGSGGGVDAWADRVAALYETLGAPIVRTDVASAEMVKLASNAFLATKISFINEIANVSEEHGADVAEVAAGMGLDDRIGPQFLRAGVGWGGSCLVGEETVLARRWGRMRLTSLEALWKELEQDAADASSGCIEPVGLEVLAWSPGSDTPQFLPVSAATRRDYTGPVLDIRTKMGRRISCTPDHPWVVGTGDVDGGLNVKLAADIDTADWLPLADGTDESDEAAMASVLGGVEAAGLALEDVRVRLGEDEVKAFAATCLEDRRAAITHPRGVRARTGDIKRSGCVHLDELALLGLSTAGSSLGTATNGQYVRSEIETDESFWRVVGLYLAEGHCHQEARARGIRERITWSFHPRREEHLIEEIVDFWARQGVEARVYTTPTSRQVSVASRILGAWWTDVLGLGRTSYEQRVPDAIWEQSIARKRALLSGLWEGDGSWSLASGGPSVRLGWGTISSELADGVLRLLGDLGIVGSQRIARTPKSTKDTHWVTISGAEQIEALIELVPEGDRVGVLTSLGRQTKRIAPTGYRSFGPGPKWVRVAAVEERPFSGPVYSLEVPAAHTFVTTGGLISHNCFGKDVSSLKQIAGNSGYHFQLLTSVIEVNELQKRRTIGKLEKHLGPLVGTEIVLLGAAFKPNTDDMRDATSLILAGRLQGEGASVRIYDPVASERARELLPHARIFDSALEALDGADGAVLVTEWPEFAELDWAGEVKGRMKTPLVVDGRNFLDRDALRAAGFTYEGIGR